MQTTMLPLMLVPLLVWVALWGYLWTLDAKVKRLEQEMRRLDTVSGDEEE